ERTHQSELAPAAKRTILASLDTAALREIFGTYNSVNSELNQFLGVRFAREEYPDGPFDDRLFHWVSARRTRLRSPLRCRILPPANCSASWRPTPRCEPIPRPGANRRRRSKRYCARTRAKTRRNWIGLRSITPWRWRRPV